MFKISRGRLYSLVGSIGDRLNRNSTKQVPMKEPLYSLHRQTDSKGNFPFMVSNAAASVQKNGHSCKTLIFALYESFYKRGVIILLTCLERIQRHSERHTRHCESLLYIRVGIGIRPTAAAPTRADERECYVKSFKYAAVCHHTMP